MNKTDRKIIEYLLKTKLSAYIKPDSKEVRNIRKRPQATKR
jgi:hypothetical protein